MATKDISRHHRSQGAKVYPQNSFRFRVAKRALKANDDGKATQPITATIAERIGEQRPFARDEE